MSGNMGNMVMRVEDEVFIGLSPKAVAKGMKHCLHCENQTLSSIGDNPSHYFLMIHTSKYPDGAIGGILKRS
jgi:hypothetical protein